MSLQILYITVQFPAPSETFAAVEVRALRAEGADMSLATLKTKPRNAEQLNKERNLEDLAIDYTTLGSVLRGLWLSVRYPELSFFLLRMIFTTCSREPIALIKSLWILPRSLQLFETIKRKRPDIVHLFWGHYPSLVGLLVDEFLEDVTVSLSLGAYDLHSRYGPSIALAKRVPAVFTHVKANLPMLRELGVGAEQIKVIYRGIDLAAVGDTEYRKKEGRVVLAERLIPEKCTADSIKALQHVLRDHPTMTVEILGDGPERSHLEKLVKDLGLDSAVTFLGHVSHEQVYKSLCEARVFLMLSRLTEERLPNAVKEAMQAGCLCVVSRTTGIEELVTDQRTGFVIEQGDIEGAARCVSSCLEECQKWPLVRAEARRHVERSFSSTSTARQRIDAWEYLSASRSQKSGVTQQALN